MLRESSTQTHGFLTLKDLGIDVADGVSPWKFDRTQSGLPDDGNSPRPSEGLGVYIDGCLPYLSLPCLACDNIASHLPMEYDENLGL